MTGKNIFDGGFEKIKNLNAVVTFATLITGVITTLSAAIVAIMDKIYLFSDKEFLIKILVIVILAVGVVQSFLGFLLLRNRRDRGRDALENDAFKKAVRAIMWKWRTMAHVSARLDTDVFKLLFLDRDADRDVERSALTIVDTNIRSILGEAAKTFAILTNDTCSTCIKCAIPADDRLITVYRDASSEQARNGPVRDRIKERLSTNNKMRDVADGTIPYYIEDDLSKAAAKGEYTNSRTDWKSVYNATILIPIDIYEGSERGGSARKTLGHQPIGDMRFILCADNKNGGFSQEFTLEIARYVSNRLSSNLYMAEVLKLVESM